jgi:hypothetical protein
MKITTRILSDTYILILFGFFSLLSQCARSGEFLIIDRAITWDENARSAFYMFMPDATMPPNWLTPDDYYNGMIYTRYEIITVATNTPCGMQFGIFQWKDSEHNVCGELCENIRWLVNGPGSLAENGSSPSTWWQSYGGVDFSKIYDLQSLSPTIWAQDPRSPIAKPGQGGDDEGLAWARRFNWFPITVRVTVVAVSAGSTFRGWDYYIGNNPSRMPVPNFGIDFLEETTCKTVSEAYAYSYTADMTGARSGSGDPVAVQPGKNMYFRTLSANGYPASEVQQLIVPARPAAPGFEIGNDQMTTSGVSADYIYSEFPDMSRALQGDGHRVFIPRGAVIYFQKVATRNSFRSHIQALRMPDQPERTFILSPNPSNDGKFDINTDIEFPFNLEVINAEGQILKKITCTSGFENSMDLGNLEDGPYYIRVLGNQFTLVRKVMKF